MISFEPDNESLEEARLFSIEQGLSLESIDADALRSYMITVKNSRLRESDDA